MTNADPTLDDVCEFIVDCLHATAPVQDEGYPLIRTPNIDKGRLNLEGVYRVSEDTYQEWTRRAVPETNDLILAREAPAGNVAIVKEGQQVCLGQRTVHLRPDKKQIDSDFLCYFLNAPMQQGRLLAGETGATSKHVNMRDIRRLTLEGLPKLEVQERIGKILAAYDDLIENNRRRIQLLEQAARLLYKEWFVHLRFPDHEHVKIKDGVPEGWEKKPLSEIADFRLGKMLDQKKNRGELKPYLANVNVRWGGFELSDLREMRFEPRELERFGLKSGDIVMCEGGEPGRCSLWRDEIPGMMIQKALHRIRPKKGIDYRYLYHNLFHKARHGHLATLFTGATIKHLPREKLALVEIEIPPASLMKLFVEQVSPIETQIGVLQSLIIRLIRARDLLLPRLMSGEITV